MTAYQLTPVGPEGPELHRTTFVRNPSKHELLVENQRLKEYLEVARADVCTYRRMWEAASNERLKADRRAQKAFRVLASIGRLNPFVAALVERGRVEVYGRLP